jgi:hypothetical protein
MPLLGDQVQKNCVRIVNNWINQWQCLARHRPDDAMPTRPDPDGYRRPERSGAADEACQLRVPKREQPTATERITARERQNENGNEKNEKNEKL